MKVKKSSNATFEKVKIGEIFVWDDMAYMRLSSISDGDRDYNSVNLETGIPEYCDYDESVMIYPEAELII